MRGSGGGRLSHPQPEWAYAWGNVCPRGHGKSTRNAGPAQAARPPWGQRGEAERGGRPLPGVRARYRRELLESQRQGRRFSGVDGRLQDRGMPNAHFPGRALHWLARFECAACDAELRRFGSQRATLCASQMSRRRRFEQKGGEVRQVDVHAVRGGSLEGMPGSAGHRYCNNLAAQCGPWRTDRPFRRPPRGQSHAHSLVP